MKYMVMECHPGYAVVLDENGQFSKVANMRYEIGQTVTDVVPLKFSTPQTVQAKKGRWLYSVATAAACLVLLITSALYTGQTPYASVYMTINPQVRIDVNKKDVVVGLEGINTDGEKLLEDYKYRNKELELVMDELVDLAIEKNFLHEGGTITLTLDAENGEWVISHSETLKDQLKQHLADKMTVEVDVTDQRQGDMDDLDDDDTDDLDDDGDDMDDTDDLGDDMDDVDDLDNDMDESEDIDDFNNDGDNDTEASDDTDDDGDDTEEPDDIKDEDDPDELEDIDSEGDEASEGNEKADDNEDDTDIHDDIDAEEDDSDNNDENADDAEENDEE